ncbi:MAG: DUF423 domain-containing protein, partial [Planctomycetota bacterium]
MSAWWRPLACILAGLAVGLGALGAHALRDRLTEEALGWYQTGVWYHFAHAIGMWMAGGAGAGAGATPPGRRRRAAAAAAWLFLAGIFLFSGSLYLLAIT